MARGQLSSSITRAPHHGIVAGGQSRRGNLQWLVIAVGSRVALHDLHAAAVAMHIAEAADVHQNVEAELLTGTVGARNLVVTAAMAQTEIDHLAALRFRKSLYNLANLQIRVIDR